MQLIQVYKCLCDLQRLRILNLLREGPLCVCHLVEILDTDQVKISKQLRYMKELGMVQGEREAQWMVYRLPAKPHPLLTENLKCLQDCARECPDFRNDLRLRRRVIAGLRNSGSTCPGAVTAKSVKCC
jgi:ArsR family transcriptional regulator, arsenate/arsenite/antimonite-responsive transcriptional repressor